MVGVQSVTAVTIAGAFVFGVILVLLESLRPVLVKRLGISEARVDWLLSMFNLSLIPMMLISGVLIDKVSLQGIFVVGAVVTAMGLFMLSRSEIAVGALGAVLLAGAGGACLSTASTVLMQKAFFENNEAASQNLGNVFFGLGALLTPVVAAWLIERAGYRRGLGILAMVCLLPALLAAVTVRSAFFIEDRSGHLGDVFADPVLWLTGLIFFLYAPLEGSIGTWATRYLEDRGVRERPAVGLLTGFWLTFLAARLVAALLLEYRPIHHAAGLAWLIVILAVAAAVALGNMAGARSRFSGALGLLLVGAFFGPIFPTLVALLLEHPGFTNVRGTAYGAMFALGATGNLFLPPLFGTYARRTTVQQAMRIPMVWAIALALVTLFLGFGWGGAR